MPTSNPATLTLPEIAPSDLEAARRFLIGDADERTTSAVMPGSRPRAPRSSHDSRTPTCHLGITRARFRSTGRGEG
jgi:hypothetical protein